MYTITITATITTKDIRPFVEALSSIGMQFTFNHRSNRLVIHCMQHNEYTVLQTMRHHLDIVSYTVQTGKMLV